MYLIHIRFSISVRPNDMNVRESTALDGFQNFTE